jgi:Acyl-CoA dehydrogenase, N-terminal domain
MAMTGRAATADEVTGSLLDSVRVLAPLIRDHADEAERNHRLSPPVVRALADAGVFRMGVPRALGGLEVSPLTFYRVVEEAARLDGSTGWCLFIGGASALAGAYLSDEAAQDIFGRGSTRRNGRLGRPRGQGHRMYGRVCCNRAVAVRERLSALELDLRRLPRHGRRSHAPDDGRHPGSATRLRPR